MDTLEIATRERVRWITLNRPESRNALNDTLLEELPVAFDDANGDPAVRAVVLTGAGSVFCAGGDLKQLLEGRGPLDVRHLLTTRITPMVQRLRTMDKPVICALNGAVAGGGLALPLACDLVIAAEEARFVTAFGKIGAIPDAAVMYLMAQNIGLLRAKEIILRSRILNAREAYDLGLYNTVVAADALESTANEWAKELANGPTMAFTLAKNALREATRMPFEAFMELEANSQALMHLTHDHDEGVQAFLAKRPPNFTGQ